jgi:hypothetical protein
MAGRFLAEGMSDMEHIGVMQILVTAAFITLSIFFLFDRD